MLNTDQLNIDISVQQDDMPVRGNAMASGDDAYDREYEDRIIEDMEWNPWAWCVVCVSVSLKELPEIEGTAYLGACSYQCEDNFRASEYYEDMVREATLDLEHTLTRALKVLEGVV